jgi:nucleotide-binding universal stress UspA family protein
MSYATLMAALTVGRSNANVLEATRALAEGFDAKIIGIAFCRPIQVICQDYQLPAACFAEDRKQIDRELSVAEQEFRSCLKSRADRIEWRAGTTLSPLAVHVVQEARGADLVIVQLDRPDGGSDPTREINLTDLVMQCSRPVLLVPKNVPVTFDRILLAWKDDREAQRAATDALPLLAKAQGVIVVEIAAQERLSKARAEVDQIVGWLKQHGVSAQSRLETPMKSNAAQLNAIADQLKADLMVAGAYGRMRGRAWVLGGVTAEALSGSHRCTLLSH